MKNIFKHTLNFSLILALLVSTLQFSIYKMDCLMSGNTQISLADFEDCNENKKDGCSFSQKCCAFNQITFDFDYDTEINIKEAISFNPLMVILGISTSLLKSVPTLNFNFYTNLPPPSGYELLKVVQVFRL